MRIDLGHLAVMQDRPFRGEDLPWWRAVFGVATLGVGADDLWSRGCGFAHFVCPMLELRPRILGTLIIPTLSRRLLRVIQADIESALLHFRHQDRLRITH